jgi:hypothetical protein
VMTMRLLSLTRTVEPIACASATGGPTDHPRGQDRPSTRAETQPMGESFAQVLRRVEDAERERDGVDPNPTSQITR